MSGAAEHLGPAFALGFALGAAPGPVQVLLLSETTKRGFSGGLRVMLGANGTLLAMMLVLALGFSSFELSGGTLALLRLVGGAFLLYLAIDEFRAIRRDTEGSEDPEATQLERSLGPTMKGIVAVILNPGAWVFFATTASAVVADATADGGTVLAIWSGIAMAVGVSASDLVFTSIATGGHHLMGERGLYTVRLVLCGLLAVLGVAFVIGGLAGL